MAPRHDNLTLFEATVRAVVRGTPLPEWDGDPTHRASGICFDHLPHAFDWAITVAIQELRVCHAYQWPWTHALTEPFRCAMDGEEFVGAQGGLQYNEDRGAFE